MLAADQLAELYRTHRDESVLSVYLDADQHDFAQRGKWRVALKNHVNRQRGRAEEPVLFDRALEHLEEVLDPGADRFLSGKGWVGFATPDGVIHAESLPVSMPDLVRWERGLRVAPYARVLRRTRPVVAALVDSRRARVVLFERGRLGGETRLRADTYLGDLTDIKVRKRPSHTSGIRGQTGTDAAQTFLDVERDRLAAAVAEKVRHEAADEALVVLGGSERAVVALREALDDVDPKRVRVDPSLHMEVPDAELRTAVEEAVRDAAAEDQERLLEALLGKARADGEGCLGPHDTVRALREQRVETLVVSEGYRTEHPDRADHLEGAAWEQGAKVVELRGEPAAELDEEGEGVGAVLRYRFRGE